MTRIKGWDIALADEVAAAANRKFSWQDHNCGLFVGNCIRAMTGVDLIADLRSIESSIVWVELVREHGGLSALATHVIGINPIHPSQAMRGDVVIAPTPSGDALGTTLGICLGARCAFVAAVGIEMMPRTIATQAWSVR